MGYNGNFRAKVIQAALTGYKKQCSLADTGARPLHRPRDFDKFQVDDDRAGREYTGQSNMSKENIINLISFNQYSQAQALSGSVWIQSCFIL